MGNTYEYSTINESATYAVYAAGELDGIGGRAVKLSEGKAAMAGVGDMPAGIALLTEDGKIEAGGSFTIQIKDIGFWKAGAAVQAGDLLTPDAEGLCQRAAAGQYAFARALSGAAAKGGLVMMQIINAGYAKGEA